MNIGLNAVHKMSKNNIHPVTVIFMKISAMKTAVNEFDMCLTVYHRHKLRTN